MRLFSIISLAALVTGSSGVILGEGKAKLRHLVWTRLTLGLSSALSVRTPRTLPPERTIRTSASVSERRLAALISGSSASIVTKSFRITSPILGTADAPNPFPQRRSLISTSFRR